MATTAGSSSSWAALGVLATAAVVWQACTTDPADDSDGNSALLTEVLSDLGKQVLVPTYARADQAALALVEATTAWSEAIGDGATERAAAQTAWRDLMDVWQEAELMQFGPAGSSLDTPGGDDLRDELYSWPTTNPCRVDQETTEAAFIDAAYPEGELVNVYGLDALEYLLFHPGTGNDCPSHVAPNSDGTWTALSPAELAQQQARQAVSLANHVRATTRALHDAWATGDAAEQAFPSPDEGLATVFHGLLYLETDTKDRKLLVPAGQGECGQTSCPDEVEAPWSDHSLANLSANLRGFRAVFTGADGKGLDDLLIAAGHDTLVTDVLASIDAADAAIEAVPGPLEQAVLDDLAPVQAALDALKVVTDHLKHDVSAALLLEVPSEVAGDDDEGLVALVEALTGPFVQPAQRFFIPSLLGFFGVAAAWAWRRPGPFWRNVLAPHLWTHPSSRLDLQLFLFRRLLTLLATVPAFGGGAVLAVAMASSLSRTLGHGHLAHTPAWLVTAVYTLVLFIAWDLSRYIAHRLMHTVPALWRLHQVHHSAEVLTPLTFYRVHPLESVVYAVRGALVTGVTAGVFFWLFGPASSQATLLGVNALAFALTALSGNLRHSHVWISYGPTLERWFISPAQHQLHHSRERAHQDSNYGTWLAVWDRLAGSLHLAPEAPPAAFGLDPADRQHRPDDLLSALFDPLLPRQRPAMALLALAVFSPARAEEPEPEEADADADYEVMVQGDGEDLRIAGSAHVIDEEQLERFEYDDIHRVLATVPGVYLRDEDGFGLRPNIGIRGANSDRSAKITLLEDGLLLGPAPYSAPAAYYFPMTTRMVTVEVFKGPSAIQHGPQTVGGAINLRTRPVPRDGQGAIDLAAGLRGAFKAHAWGGAGGERWGVLFEGVQLNHGGFKQLDGGGPTGFDKSEFMAKAEVRSDPERTVRHALQLKAGYAREVSHETYLGLTDDDFDATPFRRYAASANALMRWRRTQAELAYTLRAGKQVDLRIAAYHHWMHRDWTKLNRFADGPDLHDLLNRPDGGQAAVYAAILRGDEDTVSDDQILQIGSNDRTYHAWGVQAVAHHRASGEVVAHQLEVGARLHGDQIVRLHTEDPFAMTSGQLVPTGGDTLTTTHNHGRATALAGYVREDLLVGPVRLLPGLRVEVIRTAFDNLLAGTEQSNWRAIALPGLGVHVQARDWLGVFAGVHRGFSPVAPGQAEETRPESSWNTEAGARIGWRGFRGEVVGFFNPYTNLTGECTFSGGCTDDQVGQQFNGGRVWVYGVETAVSQEVKVAPGWSIDGRITYAYTGSSFRTGFVSGFPQFGTVEAGDALPYVPEHQGSAGLTLLHPVGSVGLSLATRSALRDVAGQGVIDAIERVDAMAVLDLAADFHVSRHLSAYTTITNLTNAVYAVSRRPFGLRPGMPIQAMLGIKLRTDGPR